MALRRSLLTVASRMGGKHQPGLAAMCNLREQPWFSSLSQRDEEQQPRPVMPMATACQMPFSLRAYASSADAVATPTPPSGVPTTNAVWRNPTNAITYSDYNHQAFPVGDPSKRAFSYFVLTGGRFIYAAAIRLAVLKFVLSMTATKDVLAMASLEVDLASIGMGQNVTVKWRGKPVFIRRRSEDEVKSVDEVDVNSLRDPEPDSKRVVNPEWLIVIGVCTHLGCVPLANAGDFGGYFCPCHGSHYDISGRIRKGPAPYNLEVPSYEFLEDGAKVLIG